MTDFNNPPHQIAFYQEDRSPLHKEVGDEQAEEHIRYAFISKVMRKL